MTIDRSPECHCVCVIIPARNEEASIRLVLDSIPRDAVREIIVVDNGSSDRTADIARAAGARVAGEPIPGYGRACLRGIASLLKECDVVVFLDADFSDSPEELPQVIEPILRGEAELAVGSRIRGNCESGALLPQARFGNALSCLLMRWLFGVRFTDLGPFRAVTRSALDRMCMEDMTFGWTVEMQAKAAVLGIQCAEVPVSYRKRIGASKITGTLKGTVMAGFKILTTIALIWLRRNRLRSGMPGDELRVPERGRPGKRTVL